MTQTTYTQDNPSNHLPTIESVKGLGLSISDIERDYNYYANTYLWTLEVLKEKTDEGYVLTDDDLDAVYSLANEVGVLGRAMEALAAVAALSKR